jgi:hypothetical protein
MFTKKSLGTVSIISILTLASLTGCSQKKTEISESPVPAQTPVAQTPELALEFGSPLDIGNGITVTVSTPKAFTPSPYASNFVKGLISDRFTVQISNGGTSDFNVNQFAITSSSAERSCIDVLDGDNGITGAPTDPLVVGAAVTFNYAIACNTKIGEPLKISLTSPDVVLVLNGTLK